MTASFVRATPWFLCILAFGARAADFPTPLQPDPTLRVEKLPAKYPSGWAFLNYAGDRIELRNVGADSREIKAQLQAHDSATLLVGEKRPEIYVADTVWSRGVRGTRTDSHRLQWNRCDSLCCGDDSSFRTLEFMNS